MSEIGSCTIFFAMKSWTKLCLDVAVALTLVLTARAEPIAQLKATDYVNDFAHVLDQNAIAQMDEICRQIDEKAHAQIAVVSVKSLDGSDIESYAVDLFHQWGVGSKSTNRGVLILYAINDHRARIEVGYGLEPILPDGKVGGFQREAIPLMRAGNYSQALLLVTSRVATIIAQDAGVQLTTPQLAPAPAEQAEPSHGISAGGVVLLIVIVLVVLFNPLRGIVLWFVGCGMFGGRGGGGWGGGCWGRGWLGRRWFWRGWWFWRIWRRQFWWWWS
ncbi:MAG: TPM domain-containing protein [Candidatus Sulfotelmatobacter sp.]